MHRTLAAITVSRIAAASRCVAGRAPRRTNSSTWRTNGEGSPGALDESERLDVELRRRSLVYVAATRARDELTVLQRTTN
ncbi:hypothetical protein GCM10027436_25570 [Actinophytocola sediminis]